MRASLWWISPVWRRRARRVGEEKQIYWQEFKWDEININHIAEHRVEPWEAGEAILEQDRAPRAAYDGATGIIGMTLDGRLSGNLPTQGQQKDGGYKRS